MKTFRTAAPVIVVAIACAASAASVLVLFDGWKGWALAVMVFAIIGGLWNAAMASNSRWPLPTPCHYLCKITFYVFAALVLYSYAEWAGFFFALAVVLTDPLVYRRRAQAASRQESLVSPADGPGA